MSRTEAAVHGGWGPWLGGGVYYYRLRTSLPLDGKRGLVSDRGKASLSAVSALPRSAGHVGKETSVKKAAVIVAALVASIAVLQAQQPLAITRVLLYKN